jgi:hypothetical protein
MSEPFEVGQRVIKVDNSVYGGQTAMAGIIEPGDEFSIGSDRFLSVRLDETDERWSVKETHLIPETNEALVALDAFSVRQAARVNRLSAMAEAEPGLMLDEDALIASASLEIAAIRARFV